MTALQSYSAFPSWSPDSEQLVFYSQVSGSKAMYKTTIGSGTVSNRGPDGGPGRPIEEGGAGYSCLAELRTVETLRTGAAKTPFLKFADRVRIEMLDAAGRSIFGAIDQVVEPYVPAA